MASYNDFKVGLGVGFNTTNSQLQAELDKYAKNLKVDAKIGVDYTKAQADAKEAATKIQTILQSAYKDATGKDLSNSDAKRFTTKYLKEYISQINVATTASNKLVTEQKRIAAADSLKRWSTSNSAAMKQFGSQVNDIMTKLRTNTNMTGAEFNDLQTDITKLKLAARDANKIGFSFGDKLKNGLAKFGDWFGVAAIFTQTIQAGKKVVSNVIEIDTAMTDLRKVCDATDTEFKSFLTTATENAKQLGASISDVVSATADFARLGYNLPDATELARVATLYKNVGDIDISDATTSIISTMKAFNISADESEKIVDVFNEVGNRFAISSAGIGDSLQRSASSLVEANNTLEQATALSVGANDVLQDPEKVGKHNCPNVQKCA